MYIFSKSFQVYANRVEGQESSDRKKVWHYTLWSSLLRLHLHKCGIVHSAIKCLYNRLNPSGHTAIYYGYCTHSRNKLECFLFLIIT